MKYITRTVWILSVVSLLTDTASEMLYPVMPIYLKTIGFSILFIGILEGFAEASAGLSKAYFGKWSDVSQRRVPFVQMGYALSSISKPMMAIFVFPLWIFFARCIDRLGKCIRTGARDAMLSDEATIETKGKVFGFHRSMDTFGAVLGPVLALIYLSYYPDNYKTLFFIAFVPGIFAVLASFFLKDKEHEKSEQKVAFSFFSFLQYWKETPIAYKRLVMGLLIFTLFNSSDVFLLLKLKDAGFGDSLVIGIYIFYNLVYALFSFPMGILGDKFGLKSIFIFGLTLFAIVYFGMTQSADLVYFCILFLMYGIYASSTEGISKAWISNITNKKDTASAIGTFSGLQSLCTMLASSIAGIIWYNWGPSAAFFTTGSVTLGVILYFIWIPKPISISEDMDIK